MKEKTLDSALYKTGASFSPEVDTEVFKKREGRLKYWYGSVCVGEWYYETDLYRSKDYAISEMIGYLEGLEVLIKAEINNLKQELK